MWSISFSIQNQELHRCEQWKPDLNPNLSEHQLFFFQSDQTQLLLFNQIRFSICSSDCSHPLLANNAFPYPYYVSLFKHVLIQIPQTQAMHSLVCKELIIWMDYNKEEEKKKNSLNTSEHNVEVKKKKLTFYLFSSVLILCFW